MCAHMLEGDPGKGIRGETGTPNLLKCGREAYPESADCSPECCLPFFVLGVVSCSDLNVEFLHFKMNRGESLQVGISQEDWRLSALGQNRELELSVLVCFVHGKHGGGERAA